MGSEIVRRNPFLPLGVALLALTYFAVPVFARRAITVTERLTEGDTSNLTSYTTANSFSLAAGSLGVCFVLNSDADAAETIASLTHNSVTWNSIGSGTFDTGATKRITAFWKEGAQASSAITTVITGGSDAQSGMLHNCFELTGTNTSSPVLQFKAGSAGSGTSVTVTFDNARGSNSAVLHMGGTGSAATWTPEYANNGTETTYSSPTTEGITQWVVGGSDTTPLWTIGASTNSGSLAVEIAEAAAAGTTTKTAMLFGVGLK